MPMDPRAAQLIDRLGLTPHPEGGHFGEIYRSSSRVQPQDSRPARSALTTIYFLLVAGEVSRWHQVASDEVWHHYEGAPLELLSADAAFDTIARRVLGTVDDVVRPVHVVPAGEWQAARTTGAYTLVGCTVGPGFDFEDFRLLDAQSAEADSIRRRHPDWAIFI
jgi:predicted cupin superfamily sugar epimerase